MDDYIVSLVRTWVPVAVGTAVTWLAVTLGVVLDEATSGALVAASVGFVTAAYYAAARAVEQRFPALGRTLLALGLARRAPVYVAPADVPPSSYRRP